MRICTALVLSLAWTVSLADADAIAAARLAQQQIIDACGEDQGCADAVRMQFEECHRDAGKEWDRYMAATGAEEDRQLELYIRKLYSCIVDTKGEPYFELQDDAT